MVPITYVFFYYMVPVPDAVKAEIVRGGSGKTDYRYHARTGCVYKREVAHWCFCDPHMQGVVTGEKECRFCYDLYRYHTRALYGSWPQNLSHHSPHAF
jgi:hypothetical protein